MKSVQIFTRFICSKTCWHFLQSTFTFHSFCFLNSVTFWRKQVLISLNSSLLTKWAAWKTRKPSGLSPISCFCRSIRVGLWLWFHHLLRLQLRRLLLIWPYWARSPHWRTCVSSHSEHIGNVSLEWYPKINKGIE